MRAAGRIEENSNEREEGDIRSTKKAEWVRSVRRGGGDLKGQQC